jgi:DMSO/TMAO reductase YedYZ molybdopterin-dependent catalytic subunit
MNQPNPGTHLPTVGDGSGLEPSDRFYREELQLALRNRGLPLEGLRYPVTPTGIHYLLVHYDIPEVNGADWRLKVDGLVSKPLTLTLAEIRRRPARTLTVTLECAGNGRALLAPRRLSQPWFTEALGTAEWTGVPLRSVLEEAGANPGAADIVFTGLDRGMEGGQVQAYQRSLSLREATRDEVLLAYAMNGEPLPPQHGYPLRLVVPGWYGMTSVKWLGRIEAVAEPFQGYQMARAYRYARSAEEPGEPVTLIRVRALMIPPGIPDFLTRTRFVEPGPVTLTGRAWAGRVGVAGVDVSVDGGATWSQARLEDPVSPHAWTAWSFRWDARPGPHTLLVRATDADGNTQPLDPPWNAGGYGNNMAQRLKIIVA